ncbi:lytic transglycosylase domain-containing protein [Rhizobium paknamense]|uniref:Soluble lytic murein transglycosylase-like protein n=1 Tax=Rhizobium paknamense TaxID=1206817 RepID=A0ABU0I967_9HYPH|nr:transglycosylase SLT domain-containing protein [Rhizobium paknamense]MDQ0454783.1 soluble lytic murein transglycosylase-like protein [Rhizobium paknamense]
MKTHLFAAAACLAVTLSGAGQSFAGEAGNGKTLMDMIRAANEKKEQAEKVKADDNDRSERKASAPVMSRKDIGSDRQEGQSRYHGLVANYAQQYGVPVELAQAVVKIESGYNPKARGTHGEIGLMQIKPATARAMGYSGSVAGLYDPETNLKYGMKYLAMAHQLGGGTTCGAILRYNAGHGATRMNAVSKQYCGQVQAMLGDRRA